MFSKLLLLLAALFTACMAAPCSAANTRGEVFLEASTIMLGDVFSDMGDKAQMVLAQSPAPGGRIVYDVNALLNIAKKVGIEWKPASNYERVTIIRASDSIKHDDVINLVRTELKKTLGDKEIDLSMDNRGLEIHRPKNSGINASLVDFKHDPIKNRFTANLIITDGQNSSAEITPIAGRAMPMVDVAILSHALEQGSTLSDSNIEWSRVAQDKAGSDAITDMARLRGVELRRNLNAGAVLRLRDVRAARLITKGALVSITIETPIMHISSQGRALSDGAMGETIRIMNTQSNRTIDGVVTGTNQVSVMPVNQPAIIAQR